MKNRIIKIVIISIEVILFYFLFISDIIIECAFRKFLNIECVGCGLTRAFKAIFDLNFIEAYKYNILSIPIFIFLIILNFCLAYDIFVNKNTTERFIKKISKYYIIILILVIITTLINNFSNLKLLTVEKIDL